MDYTKNEKENKKKDCSQIPLPLLKLVLFGIATSKKKKEKPKKEQINRK